MIRRFSGFHRKGDVVWNGIDGREYGLSVAHERVVQAINGNGVVGTVLDGRHHLERQRERDVDIDRHDVQQGGRSELRRQ